MLKLFLDKSTIKNDQFMEYKNIVNDIHEMIHNKTGEGSDFLGWVNYVNEYNQDEYFEMKKIALNFQNKIQYLVIAGIGGSYLGARNAIEMINGIHNKDQKVKIIYAGHTMSSTYTKQLLDFLANKKFGICVISKSGGTTETAIAFRLLQKLLINNVGKEESKKLIICITDASEGNLRKIAIKNNYKTFVMPKDIGGRFSVLTPVGIFPMLVAGINTDEVYAGAKLACNDLNNKKNTAYEYALARFILYKNKKYPIELLTTYESQLEYFNEWWKQLFGESEGKENKGLFPASCVFTSDLHTLGQFIQEGPKIFFETVIKITAPKTDLKIITNKEDYDKLNYLNKKSLNEINYIIQQSVLEAHNKTAKIPNIIIELNSMDAKHFGYITYWFFKACAMSGYLLGINPFDQPGVEIYKNNMFKLLGKK